MADDERARLRLHFATLLGMGESEAPVDDMVEAAMSTLGDATTDTLVSHERALEQTLRAGSTDGAPELTLPDEAESRYVYGQELGRGGLGRVVEAYDRALGRTVAIKELLGTGNARAEARFLTEARLTGQLSHPNVIPVHELGRHADGQPYYVMRKVEGSSLRQAMENATTLAERLALLPHFTSLCQAVAFAHENGVLHRDLKPDNVMVSEYGTTLLVDWGLAKARDDEDDVHDGASFVRPSSGVVQTLDGQVLGTPAYMSPEQARGNVKAIDERSDVWSLGAILFEMLAGRPLFLGASLHTVLVEVMAGPIPDLAELAPGVPADLVAIVTGCLTRDRAARIPLVDEILEALDAFQKGDLERRAIGLEALLDASASPAVSRALRNASVGLERRHIGVLMTDLHRFSALLERADERAFTDLLTPYYDLVVEEVERHGGHVNKLIGDSTLCFFNAPDPVDAPARAAVEAAARIRDRFMAEIHAHLPDSLKSCVATISVHAGEAWVGRIGSARRVQYTAFGDTINVPYEINATLSEEGVVITDVAWTEAREAGLTLEARDVELVFQTKLGPTRCRELA